MVQGRLHHRWQATEASECDIGYRQSQINIESRQNNELGINSARYLSANKTIDHADRTVIQMDKPLRSDTLNLSESANSEFNRKANIAVTTSPQCMKNIRLLTFNIQLGIRMDGFHQYLTRGWQHILPSSHRRDNLDCIGDLLGPFDIVALQETDGGSLRTGYLNQVEYLANIGEFPYWYQQRNRNFGRFAQHGNGFLSRLTPYSVEDHKLPSMIPGRGAIVVELGDCGEPILLVMMHLSLGLRAKNRQLAYIAEIIQGYEKVILMGDMNSNAHQLLEKSPLKHTPLMAPFYQTKTYPSWDPRMGLDHILVSPNIHVQNIEVLDCPVSDHVPIAVEIALPQSH